MTSLKFRASKQRTLALKGPLKTASLRLATSPTPTVYTQCSSPRDSGLRVEMCRFSAGMGTSLSRTVASCLPRWPHPMMPTFNVSSSTEAASNDTARSCTVRRPWCNSSLENEQTHTNTCTCCSFPQES